MNTDRMRIRPSVAVVLGIALLGVLHESAPGQSEAPLRVGDSMEIKISGVPANESASFGLVNVSDDGTINLHLLGKVQAAGYTASQLQSNIEQRYISEGIYTTPTIIITTQGGARLVNVSGAVQSEQRVTWTPDMTLMSAINAAGGFTDFADMKKVRLTRGNSVSIHDCKKIIQDPTLDVEVRPGDSILVRQKIF